MDTPRAQEPRPNLKRTGFGGGSDVPGLPNLANGCVIPASVWAEGATRCVVVRAAELVENESVRDPGVVWLLDL